MSDKLNIRVVLADDEAHVRLFVKAVLTSLGCQVVGEAADGRQAVELFDTHAPDLVLLDAGQVEERVGGPLDVLHLVCEIHAGDLARAVPADVTLLSLNGDISTASGGSGIRSAISAPAITVTGCAPGQTEVARLMARLRDIDGVSRVSLSKSAER